jgi:hypothetical protein
MTPEIRERARALFHEGVGLPPGRRPAFLEAACGGDAGLRAEVEALRAQDQRRVEHHGQRLYGVDAASVQSDRAPAGGGMW